MALRFSLFRTPKHRVFDYRPRYVDEAKERKDELDRLVEEAKSGNYNPNNAGSRIRQGLRTGGVEFSGQLRKEALSQRVRFLIISGFLLFLIYILFEYS